MRTGIRENLEAVRENIAKSCILAGRKPEEVLLVAVTKYVGTERIQEAIAAGTLDFGENHAQEVREKLSFFKQNRCNIHFIGHLQSNKIKYICGETALIQSVDSLSLAEQIQKKAASLDIVQDILIQVNIGEEEQKSGIPEAETSELVGRIGALENLKIHGLMCVPPAMDAEAVRPYFREMRRLLEKTASEYPELPLNELSMGMSGDYRTAVEEGATIVRVGSAIFGARDRK